MTRRAPERNRATGTGVLNRWPRRERASTLAPQHHECAAGCEQRLRPTAAIRSARLAVANLHLLGGRRKPALAVPRPSPTDPAATMRADEVFSRVAMAAAAVALPEHEAEHREAKAMRVLTESVRFDATIATLHALKRANGYMAAERYKRTKLPASPPVAPALIRARPRERAPRHRARRPSGSPARPDDGEPPLEPDPGANG
jgi:hypothetical protein